MRSYSGFVPRILFFAVLLSACVAPPAAARPEGDSARANGDPLGKLGNTPVAARSYKGLPVARALQDLATASGVDIVVNLDFPDEPSSETPAAFLPVNMTMRDPTAYSVLTAILRQKKLRVQVFDADTIIVTDDEHYYIRPVTGKYDLSPVVTRFLGTPKDDAADAEARQERLGLMWKLVAVFEKLISYRSWGDDFNFIMVDEGDETLFIRNNSSVHTEIGRFIEFFLGKPNPERDRAKEYEKRAKEVLEKMVFPELDLGTPYVEDLTAMLAYNTGLNFVLSDAALADPKQLPELPAGRSALSLLELAARLKDLAVSYEEGFIYIEKKSELDIDYFYACFDLREPVRKGSNIGKIAAEIRKRCRGEFDYLGWSTGDRKKGVLVLGRFLFVSASKAHLAGVKDFIDIVRKAEPAPFRDVPEDDD